MAHLDTAYKIGALQAQADFDQEIQKLAQDDILPDAGIKTPSRANLAAQNRVAPARGSAPVAPLRKDVNLAPPALPPSGLGGNNVNPASAPLRR